MSALSLIWGILAILGMVVAFFPCLGALNWLNIPFAVGGLVLSVIALAKAPPGNQGAAKAGLALNAVAVVLGLIRLGLGGGIF